MKWFLLFFQFFTYSILIYSQALRVEGVGITSTPSGYQVNSLSGYGFENNSLTTVSNISGSNPSLITDLTPFTLGISKQFNSTIISPYPLDLSYSQILNWIPQSAGFLINLDEFRLGAGMNQTYNMGIDLEPIPVTTEEQPDGTGEFIDASSSSTIITSSLLAAYPFHNLFSESDQLSIGAQLNLHFIHYKESVWNIGIESDFKDVSWNAGINYKFSSSIPLTQISVFFEKGTILRNDISIQQFNMGRRVDINPSDSNTIPADLPSTLALIGYVPDKLSLGMLYKSSEKFIVTGNITNVFWNSYNHSIHNQIEFSSSFIYKWENFITTSAGIYLSDRVYTEEYYTYNENSAVFLSLGTIINLPGFNIEAALADSHLFSDETRKQTLIKIGLNIFM